MPTEEQIQKVINLIKSRYNADTCGWTADRSRGNSDDVFEDGEQRGESMVLYEIGCLLGLKLDEPTEQDF